MERIIYTFLSVTAIEVVCNHMSVLCDAARVEIDHSNSSTSPTVDEAFKNGVRKYGSYLLMLSDLMQCFSDCKADFTRLNSLISLSMQNMNDRANLWKNKELFPKYKIFAEDISGGFYSLPIVLAVQNESLDREKVLNIVRKKTREVDLKNLCVDLIVQLGGIEESNILEKELDKLILEDIDKLGGNPILLETVKKMRECKHDAISY